MSNKNPWEQSFSYIFRKGEFLGITLRIWQWPIAILTVIPPPILWLVGLLGWLEIPGPLYLVFPVIFFVAIMLPDNHLQGFADWFGWPYILRRSSEDVITTPKLGISLRISLRVINSINFSWLIYFNDFRTHAEAGIPPNVILYLWICGMAFLTFSLLDEKWPFRRTMLSVIIAGVLVPWATVVTVNWLWNRYGIAICPPWLPIGICPE